MRKQGRNLIKGAKRNNKEQNTLDEQGGGGRKE